MIQIVFFFFSSGFGVFGVLGLIGVAGLAV